MLSGVLVILSEHPQAHFTVQLAKAPMDLLSGQSDVFYVRCTTKSENKEEDPEGFVCV